MKIQPIDELSPHLAAVKALGKANAATLGLFPDGAFDDYANRGTILVALNDQEQCVGYLLYRITRGYASIVHLCVAASSRGKGIARHLFNYLYENTRILRGIRADCRRDYLATDMWPRLGFHAVAERPGRAKSRTMLTVWWFDHGHPDLFTMANIDKAESKLRVAIDTNIFYDLHDQTRADRNESLALLADWLQADIELCVSDELWNEINRGNDEAQRQQARRAAERLMHLTCQHKDFENVHTALRPLFPQEMSRTDEGDLRQLARAIAAGVLFFVTRDNDLLAQASKVHEMYGVSILRPSDLIVHLDELRRGIEYQPARLAGTLMGIRRIQSKEQTHLAPLFHNDTGGEMRADFDRLLRRLLAEPTTYECMVALDDSQNPLAIIAYDRSHSDKLSIPLLRVRAGALAATLARYLILSALLRSAQEQRQITQVTDQYLDAVVIAALQDDAFIPTSHSWLKLNLAVAEDASDLADRLQTLTSTDSQVNAYACQLGSILSSLGLTRDVLVAAELERILWPAKITDADIPTFLVPIRPYWAQELFDIRLANQTLFGTTRNLALNREGIYYKSQKPQIFTVPGRILWYVSQDRQQRYQGDGAVRACSRLEEVILGLPKDLFRRFRRFGIYEWPHVLETAKGDMNQPIMVLRFSNTELFTRGISLGELRGLYTETGRHVSVQGPSRVSAQLFAQIYQRGKGLPNM